MPDTPRWGLSVSDLAIIRSALARNPRIRRVLLFGSRAKGNYRTGSDIDLALVGDHLTRQDIVETSMTLNEETPLPYRFDVVDRNHLENRDLTEHIDRIGQELYTRYAG